MALGPSAWGYIGSSGYYDPINQQQQSQNAQNQAYGSLLGGLAGYQNAYGGLANQMAMQYYPHQDAVIATTNANHVAIQSPFQGVAQAPAKAKTRAKRLIDRLRAEINEWHGDVLCRMEPA